MFVYHDVLSQFRTNKGKGVIVTSSACIYISQYVDLPHAEKYVSKTT